jgi:VWFA-related protein
MGLKGNLRAAALATLPLVLTGAVAAQQSQAAATASTAAGASGDARLINIPVVVLDKKGALVQNLTKDDFVLEVDKKPASISAFSASADLPLTLGLLVDTSATQRDSIEEERAAGAAFADLLNGPADRDKGFIVQFARQTDLLQDTTSSKPKLEAAAKQFTIDSSGATASVTPVSDPRNRKSDNEPPKRGAGTTLYDALFLWN